MTGENRSYALPTASPPALDLLHHVSDLAELRALLEGRGIQTRGTRIERYAQYLREVSSESPSETHAAKFFQDAASSPFEQPIDVLMYVLREVHELMWIVAGLRISTPEGIDDNLRKIIGGRDFAALDADSASRNAQFELRIASYLCQGGYDVDLTTETDIIARKDKNTFYVECKRVASPAQLHKRFSEARKQLAARMPKKDGKRTVIGGVAVDVTKVAFPHNGLTWGISNEHSRDVVNEKLHVVQQDCARFMQFDSPRSPVFYWLQIHIASLIMRPEVTPATRFSSYFTVKNQVRKKEERGFKDFYRVFELISASDPRSERGTQFVPKQTITIPAGSVLSVDEDRIGRLFAQSHRSASEQDEEIATLEIGDTKIVFTFFELSLLPSGSVEEWQLLCRTERARAYAALVAKLYWSRFPYEGDGQTDALGPNGSGTLPPPRTEAPSGRAGGE